MTENITSQEMAMLQNIRAKADELSRLWQEANAAGFNLTININPMLGACDNFQVHKMVPIDLRSASN
jgi:hypothetical protein